MTEIRLPTGSDLRCAVCLKPGPGLDVDHIINRGMGGSALRDVPENKISLCRPCHELKTEHRIKTWLDGQDFCWKKAGADVIIRTPVSLSERHKQLVLDATGASDHPDSLPGTDGSLPPVGAGEDVSNCSVRLPSATVSPALIVDGEGPLGTAASGDAGDDPLNGPQSPGQGPALVVRKRQPSPFSLEDWMEQGRCLRDEGLHLRKLTTEWAFRVGTWWNDGERQWPHESSQMMDELGLSYWQITKFASIAARVPEENRLSRDKNELLTIEHYRAVANLPPGEQPEALEMAIEDRLSASSLKLWIAQKKGATAVVAAPERERCQCPTCGDTHWAAVREEWKG